MKRAIFIGEGSSDAPLAVIVARLFAREGVRLDVAAPDFDRLPSGVGSGVESRIRAAYALSSAPVDLFIVHRDADSAGPSERREEIARAVSAAAPCGRHLPVVPVRMTEAWLLLDEQALRRVAGNPRGTISLSLPHLQEVERRSDPKALLADAVLTASEESGRRRDRVRRRFPEHRRRLLECLDVDGPVTRLSSWQALVADVGRVAHELRNPRGDSR